MRIKPDEPDPQRLLPEELRSTWFVAPRVSATQLVIVGMILGAGIALTVVGLVLGNRWLFSSWLFALALCYVQNKVFRRIENRHVRRLGDWFEARASDPSGRVTAGSASDQGGSGSSGSEDRRLTADHDR